SPHASAYGEIGASARAEVRETLALPEISAGRMGGLESKLFSPSVSANDERSKQMHSRQRYQHGCLTRKERIRGENVWEFRYDETTPESHRYPCRSTSSCAASSSTCRGTALSTSAR